MAKLFIEDTSLTAIGDAIRSKSGSSELLSVPDGMVAAIEGITTGGGSGSGELPEELRVITGNVQNMFCKDYATLYINAYGNQITTKDLIDAQMFNDNDTIEEIPFDINIASGFTNSMFYSCNNLKKVKDINIADATKTSNSINQMFYSCFELKEIGAIRNPMVSNCYESFRDCRKLNYIPIEGAVGVDAGIDRLYYTFYNCWGLRELDSSFLKLLRANYKQGYEHTFNCCYSMDRIVGLGTPISSSTKTYTDNLYKNTFRACYRLDELTFETNDDGTPKELYANNQIIDLSYGVGYCPASAWYKCSTEGDIMNGQSVPAFYDYIKPSASSSALKSYQIVSGKDTEYYYNQKDSWTESYLYSRYNHRSMVNTINTLPDTSTFLSTNGGTNIIKFKSAQGDNSPWGGASNLTEEEIAVATAKGWTVSLV